MKNLFKPLIALAIIATAFTSCMDDVDNTDYEAQALANERSLDSLLTTQKLSIEAYVAAEFTEVPAIRDTATLHLPRLGKRVNRGMYYQVLVQPTDTTYEYKFNGSGFVAPTVKLNYWIKTLNNNVVKKDETGGTYTLNNQNAGYNLIWMYSFFPYSVTYNGFELKIDQGLYNFGGLTRKGLKAGTRFRVITPSSWVQPNNTSDIPPNQPLVYEFEVLSIQ
ncbi:hypothetical protein [Sphingobacterium deserti]|uniref:Peptidylprolyl isomerase FKBP-type n=1 Tax=Sphingobacterium deserti TaxID=1229276 RepID=A0A0B8T2M9_9SPHI|nr:hypothetical protein [Sphingobacterium deserti]KGE15186.1 peptidylprolyl isomerase FKBP-type [Sphingobacterium deserti]